MRHLELIGAEEPTSSAVLDFASNPAGYTSIVHSTGWPPGSGGAVAVVLCGEVYVDHWHDLVRNERPLHCGIAYADADPDLPDPQRKLLYLRASTGDQPPGEGTEGPLARLGQALDAGRPA